MNNCLTKGNWEELGKYARSVRDAVFIKEQGISEDLEHDDRDSISDHVVLFLNQLPIATGRIERNGKIGRVAVLAGYRRKEYGKTIMKALEEIAHGYGMTTVFVHSQSTVIPFYRELGYIPLGDEMIEADIPHQLMEKQLSP